MTTVQSVERAFAILETFDEEHPTRSAAEIAELAGLARPTTYRMLQTLQQLGYVRNIGGRFEVTPRVLRLGAGYLGRRSLAAKAQPVLDQLSEELGEIEVAVKMRPTRRWTKRPRGALLQLGIEGRHRMRRIGGRH